MKSSGQLCASIKYTDLNKVENGMQVTSSMLSDHGQEIFGN